MQARRIHIKLVSGLLFILYCGAVQAEYDVADLKKLFTDRSQRARIDAMRLGDFSADETLQTRKIKVSGYVTRSDGKSVVWLNNKNTLDGPRLGDVKIRQSTVGKNKRVTLIMKEKTIHLKAGETWSEMPGHSGDNP